MSRNGCSTNTYNSASAGYQDAWQRVSVMIFSYSAVMDWMLRINSFKERPDDFQWGQKTKLMLQKRIKMGTF